MNCGVIHFCHFHSRLFPAVYGTHCQEVTASWKEAMKVSTLAPPGDIMAQEVWPQGFA